MSRDGLQAWGRGGLAPCWYGQNTPKLLKAFSEPFLRNQQETHLGLNQHHSLRTAPQLAFLNPSEVWRDEGSAFGFLK